MQGTLVMLVGLSGLGCHNKGCDVAYAPPSYSSCFGGGCYANWYPEPVTPACYSSCYSGGYSGCYGGSYGGGCYGSFGGSCFGSCYGGSFDSCYGGGCYTGHHRRMGGCGLGKLFSCFHKNRSSCYADSCYSASSCYSSCYSSSYSPAIFGSALGMNYAPYSSGQSTYVSGQSLAAPSKQWGGTSSMTPTSATPAAKIPSEAVTPVAPTPVSASACDSARGRSGNATSPGPCDPDDPSDPQASNHLSWLQPVGRVYPGRGIASCSRAGPSHAGRSVLI